MPNLFGTAPNQAPTNGDLGTLAFQDANAVKITGGEVTAVQKTDTAISETMPSLNLDFANTKSLDPRITFTRNTTATFYDGKTVAKAEENLLTYSEQIDQWSLTNCSVVKNVALAPDGNMSADQLTFSTGSGLTNQSATLATGSTYTFSVWMRTDSGTLDVGIGSINAGVFETKTVTTTWTRFTVTQSASASTRYPGIQATGVTGTIYIWGAQLEQRSAVSSYTPTTSSPVTNYIPALQTCPANSARFDHDPITGESKGLLIEEQRTNLLTYSDQFDNAAWNKTNATITPNVIVSPVGTLDGESLTSTAVGSYFSQLYATSATTYTLSTFAKATKAGDYLAILIQPSYANRCGARFDLNTGTVIGASAAGTTTNPVATIANVGNGWYRCSLTATVAEVSSSARWYFGASDSSQNNIDPFNSSTSRTIYIWGAQLEAGAFPTSYIPTTDQQKTRSADAASITGTNFSSWFRADEGTVYAEAQTAQGSNAYLYSLFGSGTDNRIYANFDSNQRLTSGARINGTFEAALSSAANSAPINTFGKCATGYKANDFGISWNGISALTDSSTNLPNVVSLFIGNNGGLSNNWLNGYIKKLTYFPKRLSNDELVEMTS